MMSFLGGTTEPDNNTSTPNVINYNSTGGALEFHGFSFQAGNTDQSGGNFVAPWNFNFPGSAAIGWFGGTTMIDQLTFNGSCQLHGVTAAGILTPIYQIPPTNLGGGIWQEYGHDGFLVGAACSTLTTAFNGAMSFTNGSGIGGATITVVGTDMAGIITLTLPAGANTGTGELGQITFALAYPFAPVAMIFPAEANSASQLTNVYIKTATTTTGSFQLWAIAALPGQPSATTTYQWTYLVIG